MNHLQSLGVEADSITRLLSTDFTSSRSQKSKQYDLLLNCVLKEKYILMVLKCSYIESQPICLEQKQEKQQE